MDERLDVLDPCVQRIVCACESARRELEHGVVQRLLDFVRGETHVAVVLRAAQPGVDQVGEVGEEVSDAGVRVPRCGRCREQALQNVEEGVRRRARLEQDARRPSRRQPRAFRERVPVQRRRRRLLAQLRHHIRIVRVPLQQRQDNVDRTRNVRAAEAHVHVRHERGHGAMRLRRRTRIVFARHERLPQRRDETGVMVLRRMQDQQLLLEEPKRLGHVPVQRRDVHQRAIQQRRRLARMLARVIELERLDGRERAQDLGLHLRDFQVLFELRRESDEIVRGRLTHRLGVAHGEREVLDALVQMQGVRVRVRQRIQRLGRCEVLALADVPLPQQVAQSALVRLERLAVQEHGRALQKVFEKRRRRAQQLGRLAMRDHVGVQLFVEQRIVTRERLPHRLRIVAQRTQHERIDASAQRVHRMAVRHRLVRGAPISTERHGRIGGVDRLRTRQAEGHDARRVPQLLVRRAHLLELVPRQMPRARQEQPKAVRQLVRHRRAIAALRTQPRIQLDGVAQALGRLVLPHVVGAAKARALRLERLGNRIDTRARAALRLDERRDQRLRHAAALARRDKSRERQRRQLRAHPRRERLRQRAQVVVGEEQDKVTRLHRASEQRTEALRPLVVKQLRVPLQERVQRREMREHAGEAPHDRRRARCLRVHKGSRHERLEPHGAHEARQVARERLEARGAWRVQRRRHSLLGRPRAQRSEEHPDRMRHVVRPTRGHVRMLRRQGQGTHTRLHWAVAAEKVDHGRRRRDGGDGRGAAEQKIAQHVGGAALHDLGQAVCI